MRILIRPDLSPTLGSGHVMRTLALAEVLIEDGHEVVYACDTEGLSWVADAIVRRGCILAECAQSGDPRALIERFQSHAVVVDSYTMAAEQYLELATMSPTLVAVVDGERRGATGDLLIDQNPGAQSDWSLSGTSEELIAGLDYALIRRDFVRCRERPRSARGSRPEVLVVVGGTDPLALAPKLAEVVLATSLNLNLTVITRADLADSVRRIPCTPWQRAQVLNPTSRLAELARNSDLVVAAAGSMSWELLTVGAAASLIPIADNQQRNWERLAAAGVVHPLGVLDDLEQPQVITGRIKELLTDPERLERLRAAALQTVDGRGARRVAEALYRRSGITAGPN